MEQRGWPSSLQQNNDLSESFKILYFDDTRKELKIIS